MLERIKKEPAVLITLIVAVLILVRKFGVPLGEEQTEAIVAVVEAGVMLLGGVAIRARVSPVGGK